MATTVSKILRFANSDGTMVYRRVPSSKNTPPSIAQYFGQIPFSPGVPGGPAGPGGPG